MYPVYYEDQDYEWRLELAGSNYTFFIVFTVFTFFAFLGLRSVHVRDVLVVHGDEGAREYESGSMTALANRTGDEALRAAFASQVN